MARRAKTCPFAASYFARSILTDTAPRHAYLPNFAFLALDTSRAMMSLTEAANPPTTLSDDVYAVDYEFRQIARDAIDMMDIGSSEATHTTVCDMLIGTIG